MNVLYRAADRPAWGFSISRYLRNIDWILLLATLGLVFAGMAMIYSATASDPNLDSPMRYLHAQGVGLGLGLILLIGMSLLDFSWFSGMHKVLYGVSIALLLATMVFGVERMGARRWLVSPVIDIQTSELVKLLMVVALAGFLTGGVELRHRFRFVALTVVYVAVPAFLIFLQPDLGTALVFVFFLLFMLVGWGVEWRHMVALLSAGVAAVLAILRVLPTVFGIQLLEPYQIQRLLAFLDPEKDPTDQGYQLLQSKIAVASGMYTGKGFMEGTQTHLGFLPTHHTDFIFAVIGEEFGFLGACALLLLYMVVLWRILRAATQSKNLFGSLVCIGIGAVLLFQVFVNIGMSIGIMPITGLPLPFVSYGSSSLVVFLMSVGLVESVRIHSRTALYGGRFRGESYGQMAN